MHPIPNSPPPSFHSRHASPERRNHVDPDLADAFGGDDDESDDEADDRQRLVQGPSAPAEPAGAGARRGDGAACDEPEWLFVRAAAVEGACWEGLWGRVAGGRGVF